jgi:tetratricopeptide (TPR) repeat protein
MPSDRDAHLRHARYFAELLLKADTVYQQGGQSAKAGLEIFDENRANINLGQAWCAHHAQTDPDAAQLCAEYPERGAFCLFIRQKPHEQITWLESALEAARKFGYKAAVGNLLGKLGLAHANAGEYEQAFHRYSQRLEIARQLNDLDGFAECLCNLGILYDDLGDLENSQQCYENALALAAKIESPRVEGVAVGNLGLVLFAKSDYAEALKLFHRHLALTQAQGDQWAEGNALTNIGMTLNRQKEFSAALPYLSQAQQINLSLADQSALGVTLGHLAAAYEGLMDIPRAAEIYWQRLIVAQETDDQQSEARAAWNLGKLLLLQGEIERGLAYLQFCVNVEQKTGDPAYEADYALFERLQAQYGRQE